MVTAKATIMETQEELAPKRTRGAESEDSPPKRGRDEDATADEELSEKPLGEEPPPKRSRSNDKGKGKASAAQLGCQGVVLQVVMAPAKTMNMAPHAAADASNHPRACPAFPQKTAELAELLKQKSVAEMQAILSFKKESDGQKWVTHYSETFGNTEARRALTAYDGYAFKPRGMDVASLSTEELEWAHPRLAILSALYGVVRPLDVIEQYRLEMGSKGLSPVRSMRHFWMNVVTEHLLDGFKADADPVLLNLASDEYFSAVDLRRLHDRGVKVVSCIFDGAKGTNLKYARGQMARHIITSRIEDVNVLKQSPPDGWRFLRESSFSSVPDLTLTFAKA